MSNFKGRTGGHIGGSHFLPNHLIFESVPFGIFVRYRNNNCVPVIKMVFMNENFQLLL